jgi:hypothetical protein
MEVKPITLKEANEFVKKFHRHNLPVVGCKFAISALKDGVLVGVGIAGRPVARLEDNGITLEILRVCTDGTKNSNSFIYDKIRKIAALMGYKRVITYTLKKESGSSLKAIGAILESNLKPNSWNRLNRKRLEQPVYLEPKVKWQILIPNIKY